MTVASTLRDSQEHEQANGSNTVKVTILASEWGSSKGGLSTINRELAIQLAKFPEVEISFFLPQCSEKDKNIALGHNIKIVEATRQPGYDELEWLSFPPEHLQIDIIVGHGVKLGRQAQVIRQSRKCKWVQVVHTDPEELGMFKTYSNPISKGEEKHNVEVELCEMANFVVGVGPKLSEAFRSYLRGCQKDQTVLDFTPGVFDECLSVKQVLEERQHRSILVFGRGDAEDFELKGFDIAARAVAMLTDTHLVFVGASNGKHEEIRDRLLQCDIPANRLKVRSYVKNRESLKSLLCEVDLVLMPSRTEGFGLTGLEALSAGLPVLVSRNSGFGEALSKVTFGSTCVIDSEDPKLWAAAIKSIWDKNRQRRLEEAKQLRDSYEKEYSWAKQSKVLLDSMINLVLDASSDDQSSTRTQSERFQSTVQPSQRAEGITRTEHHAAASSDHQSSTKAKRERNPAAVQPSYATLLWMVMLVFWNLCDLSNDNTFIKDGCAIKIYDDVLKLKYFDFSEFITSARSDFMGRHWLYQEMDDILEQTEGRGALLIGDPGSGKTAFVCHLLCSKTSSQFIHNRILGYHFCMHSDKGTQNAAKFVQNLANMAASNIEEYREIILSDSFVHRVLQNNCPQDPEWCFQEGIVTPLTKLQHQPNHPWYIIIDALDECTANKAEILNILMSKVQRLPRWLKLIITSRNMSTVTTSLKGIQRFELRSDDKRNLEDIDRYLSHKIYPLKDSIKSRIKKYFSIKDNNTPSQKIVSNFVEKSQGNFLFVRLVLNVLFETPESVNWTQNIPETVGSVYQLYFARKFSTSESFQSLREIFEVLVASYAPLSAQDIYTLLKQDNPYLDFEYDFMPKLDEVSLFLWYGSENDLVRIYHASLSEWLTNDTNKGRFYYVKKQYGHERLAKYYLQHAKGIERPLSPEEAFYLTCHIVEGGSNEHQVHEFLSLPSSLVNSSDESNTTALHISSRVATSEVTELLAKHYFDVDFLDNDHRTPAFMAAAAGRLKNLIALFGRGANLNHTVIGLDVNLSSSSVEKDPVRECKRRACEYSLLHVAAQEGNVDVMKFLIEHHVNVMKTTGCNNTAVHLAATNGHLEVVEILKEAGGVVDDVSLHHAAAGGHRSVVDYLLNEGIRDDCINDSTLMKVNPAKTKWKDISAHMHDSYHLQIRETALHAAIRNGHVSVIASLLRQPESAVNCLNAAGRRPLHEAVHLNNYNVLKVMLVAGVDTSVRCNANFVPQLALADLQQTYCPCGFTPLHIAAMHGYHSVAKLLVTQNADVNARDCNGSTPLHIASCHGMITLVTLLVENGAKINQRSFNFSTPLHSAAACLATSSVCSLLDLGADFFAKDDQNMTALYYFAKNVEFVGREYFADLYVEKPIDWIKQDLDEKELWEKGYLQYSWLNALIRITNSFSNSNDANRISIFSDSMVKTYSTALELLEQKANASLLLTGSAGSFKRSYLVFTVTPLVFLFDSNLHTVLTKVALTFYKTYEPTWIPESLKKALTRIFNHPGLFHCPLLIFLVRYNLVRSVNVMLQAGADVNCHDHWSGLSPLLTYLRRGGRHMSKVLTKHKVTVAILCGETFESSSLHMISFHKLHYLHYLSQYLEKEDLQEYIVSDNFLFDYFLDDYEEIRDENGSTTTFRTGDGPLATAIKSHARGTKVIDECFDAEGYNAFHRAAQGANIFAIKKFLSWGANPYFKLKNADAFSPLWLSVLYSIKYTPFPNFHQKNILTALEVDVASTSASIILNSLLQNGTVNIGCKESRRDLTLYHLAAVRGMWRFIHDLLSKKKLTGMDVNCPNKDGITPMYLAMLVGGVACDWKSPWCKVVAVIEKFGGTLSYPSAEAEYFLLFHLFFEISPGHFSPHLAAEDEFQTVQEGIERNECRGYENGDGSLFKASLELNKVYHDYSENVERQELMDAFHEKELLIVAYLITSHDFLLFLEDEKLFYTQMFDAVTRTYSRKLCEPSEESNGRKSSDATEESRHQRTTAQMYNEERLDHLNQMTCAQEALVSKRPRMSYQYLKFKYSLNRLQKHLKHAQSVIFGKMNPSRVLSRVNYTLRNYYSVLRCDWQAITTKYVMLQFQLWNLELVTQYLSQNFRVVNISNFASLSMKKVFSEPSKDSLNLVLRLASETFSKLIDDFNYLTILKSRKPPLWKGTFDDWWREQTLTSFKMESQTMRRVIRKL